MLEALRGLVLRVLRVPPEPRPPEGSPESIRVFRAGRNFYYWQLLAWAGSHLGIVFGLAFGYLFVTRALTKAPPLVRQGFTVLEVLGVLGLLVSLPFTFLALRWTYELRWYMVTDRSLRIRRGVWNVEELTMTFANIQEIRVKSGPVQNLLGIADVEVRAAGGGAGAGEYGESRGHKAVFEGVDNANEIRDLITDRLRAYRDSGLGFPGERMTASVPAVRAQIPESSVAAANRVLEEARALRAFLIGGAGN